MPILGYFNNMWYGSASGAMGDTTPLIEVAASIKANKTISATIENGIEPYIKGTMGRKQTVIIEGIGEVIQALPKKGAKLKCDISIGASPSAFDIAQAVWYGMNNADTKLNNVLTTSKFIALK